MSFLPSIEQTLILRACLWNNESGLHSWNLWQSQFGDLTENIRQDTRGLKRLLPLLYIAFRHHGVVVDKFLMTCLRTARFREELRSKVFVQIFREVLRAFNQAEIPVIVLKGAALAQTVYMDPALRHCHDIDILLGERNIKKAYDLLSALEFIPYHKDVTPQWETIKFVHNSGLPVELHRHLFLTQNNPIKISDLSESLHIQDIAGVPFRVLTPEMGLIQVCCHSYNMNRKGSIAWICDAWLIIDRYPELNWDGIIKFVQNHSIAKPLFFTLNYLAKELGAPIPQEFLKYLQKQANLNFSN